jgi:hypothetical protein
MTVSVMPIICKGEDDSDAVVDDEGEDDARLVMGPMACMLITSFWH